MKNKIIKSVVTLSALALIAMPAISQAATTKPRMGRTGNASSTQERIENMQNRGEKMIDQRIANLNRLLNRIQEMKNLSDADKASFQTTIQGLITSLTTLKTQIASDTSTTSLKTDNQSITQAYRIFALVEPQLNILSASDRVQTITTNLSNMLSKIQTRLASSTTASSNPAVQTALTDISAKIADAKTQAQAASAEVSALKPDGGDKTILASNTAALKDARSKIKAAQKDLTDARKDIQTIVRALATRDAK